MRGFILTMDAMIAAMTALTMASVLSTMISESTTGSFTEQQMASTGNDLLAVMQSNDTFSHYIGLPNSTVGPDLYSHLATLPGTYCASMRITVFNKDLTVNNVYSASYGGLTCNTTRSYTQITKMFAEYTREKVGNIQMIISLRGK